MGGAGGPSAGGPPYVPRWFPKTRQGFAMGVYGAGNSGAAVNKFIAPADLAGFGATLGGDLATAGAPSTASTAAPERSSTTGAEHSGTGASGVLSAGMTVDEAERQLINITLAHTGGNKTKAATMLGISLKTLYNRLKEYAAENGESAETLR